MTEMIHGVGSALADGSAVSTSHTIHARFKKKTLRYVKLKGRLKDSHNERFAAWMFSAVTEMIRWFYGESFRPPVPSGLFIIRCCALENLNWRGATGRRASLHPMSGCLSDIRPSVCIHMLHPSARIPIVSPRGHGTDFYTKFHTFLILVLININNSAKTYTHTNVDEAHLWFADNL